MRFFLNLFVVVFLLGCSVTKDRWSKELYTQQKKQALFFARRNYELRNKVLPVNFLNRKEGDTLFLIERLSIESSTAGACYLWNAKRDTVIIYREVPHLKNGQMRVSVSVDSKLYKDFQDPLRMIVEQFDIGQLKQDIVLDGYTTFISRVAGDRVINTHVFNQ